MHYVYVIQSQKNKDLYFGCTSDLERRLEFHNNGESKSTKYGVPWVYIYTEGYRSKSDALKRESKLKHYGNARTYIKKRLDKSLL